MNCALVVKQNTAKSVNGPKTTVRTATAHWPPQLGPDGSGLSELGRNGSRQNKPGFSIKMAVKCSSKANGWSDGGQAGQGGDSRGEGLKMTSEMLTSLE